MLLLRGIETGAFNLQKGVLEIIVPHLFTMTILAFVLSHFLLFIESIEREKKEIVLLLLFLKFYEKSVHLRR